MSASSRDEAEISPPVYVYEAPVRAWHWVTAPCILLLAATGYLIANPAWPLVAGEPFHHFLMGDIRLIHFTCGYIVAIAFLVRLYWAVMGNRYVREIFIIPVWRRGWWASLARTLRWYGLAGAAPPAKAGHNPAAQLSMFVLFVLGVVFQIVTGFALYGEGARGWSHALFTSWVIPLFGSSMTVHTWHHLGMWYILLFVILHFYIALREDIMSGQTMVSTMISGWRYFRGQGQP